MKHCTTAVILGLGIHSVLYAGAMGSVETYDFSGFYVGAQVGLLSLLTDNTLSVNRTATSFSDSDYRPTSFTNTAILFNGQIGYGRMFNPVLYLGAKGSISYSPIRHSFTESVSDITLVDGTTNFYDATHTAKRSLQPIYNLDAVLGYEIWPHVLPYVEAGVSWANAKLDHSSVSTFRSSTVNRASSMTMNMDNYKTGWNVGIGTYYQPHKHWLLTTELVYTYLGNNSVSGSSPLTGTSMAETMTRTEKNNAISLMGGVSYLFDI